MQWDEIDFEVELHTSQFVLPVSVLFEISLEIVEDTKLIKIKLRIPKKIEPIVQCALATIF